MISFTGLVGLGLRGPSVTKLGEASSWQVVLSQTVMVDQNPLRNKVLSTPKSCRGLENTGRWEEKQKQPSFLPASSEKPLPQTETPSAAPVERTPSPGLPSCLSSLRLDKHANKNHAGEFLHPHSGPHPILRERKGTQTS